MKRPKAKDVEQAARRALGSGSGNEYADARTALAIEQAKGWSSFVCETKAS